MWAQSSNIEDQPVTSLLDEVYGSEEWEEPRAQRRPTARTALGQSFPQLSCLGASSLTAPLGTGGVSRLSTPSVSNPQDKEHCHTTPPINANQVVRLFCFLSLPFLPAEIGWKKTYNLQITKKCLQKAKTGWISVCFIVTAMVADTTFR